MPAEEAAAAVTPRTQLAADLQGSLTRHARAKEADVTPLDELSRDAVHAQHAWLYDSMKQTSLLLSSQGDTPRGVSLRSESDGVLPPTNSPPSIPPSISTNTDWYSSKAEDSLSRRAMLGFDGMPKLDPATAENDKAAREEAVKAQQGWMASLLMQMSQSFSPRDSRRSSVYGGASLGASALGTPVVSPVGPPDPNMSAEQSAADLAAREEALRSQQGWLAGLIAAMSNRNSINSALSLNSAMADSHRARSAADLGVAAADLGLVADGTDSEADRASRAEAVRAQQGWLANMLYGMQSFMGQSTETLGGGNTEASADNKTREEQEADLKAREEALRSQQGWLAGLLSGMSRDSLHAIPWAQQPTGTSPSATPKRTSSPGLLRRDSSVLVGSPMRAGAGVSFCLLEEEDEKEAREWELEQARLALEAAQREADAHNGSAPVQSCPRVVRPAAPPLRETPSTVKARSAAALPAAVLPAPARVAVTRAAVAVPGDDTTDDKGPVYKPDMEVYSHLARKQGWRICPGCSAGCDVCFPDGSGICGSCTSKFRWAAAEPLLPPQTLAELKREWRLKHTEMLAQLDPEDKMTIDIAAHRYWMEATPDCSAKAKAALQLYRIAIALPLVLSLPMLKKMTSEVRANAVSASQTEAAPLTPSAARKERRFTSPAPVALKWLSEADANEEVKLSDVILTPTAHDGRKMASERIVVTNPRRTPKKSPQPVEAH